MKYLLSPVSALGLLFFCLSPLSLSGGEVLLQDDFERSDPGKGWTVQTGDWKIIGGVLRGSEIEEDNHSAAARRVIETTDAVYEFRFRFRENTRGFHFGFDPKRGSLDKKGHLFSVVVDSAGFKILKHLDKNKPKEDPNEVLAIGTHPMTANEWYTLKVTTKGDRVEVILDGKQSLVVSHPSFSVPKPTLIFRVIGEGVDIDDLSVTDSSS